MKITRHWLDDVEKAPTKKMGGVITPDTIVMHYTAGWSTKGDVDTLSTSDRQASAHVVLGRDGELIQIVPFNRKAWHAGPSRFNGRSNVNDFSIGIEISNAGWIKQLTNGFFQDQYGQMIAPDGQFVGQRRTTKSPPHEWHEEYHDRLAHGIYRWEPFYDLQLILLDELVPLLIKTYDIKYIVSHEEIDTRGWKTDPGPMFPMRRYTKLLDDRAVNKPEELRVTADELNVRSDPNVKANVLTTVPQDTTLIVLGRAGQWAHVELGSGVQGWVNTYYTEMI